MTNPFIFHLHRLLDPPSSGELLILEDDKENVRLGFGEVGSVGGVVVPKTFGLEKNHLLSSNGKVLSKPNRFRFLKLPTQRLCR